MAASVFESEFTVSARGVLLAKLGKSVTYTPRGGIGSAVSALFREQVTMGADSEAVFLISKADVAAPARNDTISYDLHASDARVWVVTEYTELQSGFWRIACRSPETTV